MKRNNEKSRNKRDRGDGEGKAMTTTTLVVFLSNWRKGVMVGMVFNVDVVEFVCGLAWAAWRLD